VVALRSVGRRALFVALAIVVMCVALALQTNNASAQTTCPTSDVPNTDGGTHAIGGSPDRPSGTKCYRDHWANSSYDLNGSDGRLSAVHAPAFAVLLPDVDRPAPTHKVKILWGNSSGTPVPITSATCAGATIVGEGTNLVTVELASGSCSLRTTASPGGTLLSYEATLTRSGNA